MALREARDKVYHGYWQDALESDLKRISSWGSDGFKKDSEHSKHNQNVVSSGIRDGDAESSSKGSGSSLRQRIIGHGKSPSTSSRKSATSQANPANSGPDGPPQNVSLLPQPPDVPLAVVALIGQLQNLAYVLLFSATMIWMLVAFSDGPRLFVFRSLACAALGAGSTGLAWFAARSLQKEAEGERWRIHRARAKEHSPPFVESAEWLNAFIEGIWGTINPDLFASVVDTVEDIMQASLPQFVDAVKISDIGQGVHPIRITAIRPLPDREEDGRTKSDEERENEAQAEPGGRYSSREETRFVNLEVAFMYKCEKFGRESNRERHIHLLTQFYVGLAGWAQIPIPVWVQVDQIVGTLRLRLQMTQHFPFVRDATFSFMGVPAFRVSAIPMTRALPNVLDLPLISKFVKDAISAGTAEFTAPKSMTLNMEDILGEAAIGDTRAAGVFIITIHYAEDLSGQDRSGSSDPYIVFSYSKFGKAEYSTRIILQDLNPVFEETFPILLTSEEIKNEESLLLMLWDKDKHTKDDLIGRIRIPVKDLIEKPGEVIRRDDEVQGFEEGGKSQGKLNWSYSYWPKIPLNPELQAAPDLSTITPSKTLTEMEMRPGDIGPSPAAKDFPPPPPTPLRTPPDPAHPSGILSVIVHGLSKLEKAHLEGSGGSEGDTGQDTDDLAEIDQPSPYCEILYNDQLLYQTRVKKKTNDCIIEAGTEKFVRNYNTAVVRVVVRSSTLRERDPILGIVNLPLRDILSDACEVTRDYPLERGVGFGLARISLLFRAVAVDLPRSTQGWETGVVMITSPVTVDFDPAHRELISDFNKIVLTTADGTHTLKRKSAEGEGTQLTWHEEPVKLPVYFRQQAALSFEFHGLHLTQSNFVALAALWLHEVVDDEEREFSLPIYRAKDLKQLKQNYINDFTRKTHDMEIVGQIKIVLTLKPGLGPCHYRSPANGPSGSQGRRHALEAWDTYDGQALLAERKAEAERDGEMSPTLKRDLKKAETRQKMMHQQGRFEVPAYRTLLWAANGVQERVTPHRTTNKRRPVVLSERNLA